MRTLDEAGIALEGLTLSEPTLDDVFLRATGQRMPAARRSRHDRLRLGGNTMTDVLLLISRSLRDSLRMPAALIPNVAISVFFLFVFNAGLSSVADLPGFKGSYLAFILPVSIVSASVGGAGTAGQIAGARHRVGLLHEAAADAGLAAGLGLGPHGGRSGATRRSGGPHPGAGARHGPRVGLRPRLGLLVVLFFAFLWGMAFAGYAVFVALKTKNGAATEAATFAFFPLIFLSTTFVPKEYITATLAQVGGDHQPHHLRLRLPCARCSSSGWEATPLLIGLGVILGFATLTGALALRQARRATQLG